MKNMDIREIGDYFRSVRKAQRFTLEEAAKRADLTPQQIFKFEKGENKFTSYDVMRRMADGLGIHIHFSMREESDAM